MLTIVPLPLVLGHKPRTQRPKLFELEIISLLTSTALRHIAKIGLHQWWRGS
jgi:hypothetical protein